MHSRMGQMCVDAEEKSLVGVLSRRAVGCVQECSKTGLGEAGLCCIWMRRAHRSFCRLGSSSCIIYYPIATVVSAGDAFTLQTPQRSASTAPYTLQTRRHSYISSPSPSHPHPLSHPSWASPSRVRPTARRPKRKHPASTVPAFRPAVSLGFRHLRLRPPAHKKYISTSPRRPFCRVSTQSLANRVAALLLFSSPAFLCRIRIREEMGTFCASGSVQGPQELLSYSSRPLYVIGPCVECAAYKATCFDWICTSLARGMLVACEARGAGRASLHLGVNGI